MHKLPKCNEHLSVPIVLHSPDERVETFFFLEKPLCFFTYITLLAFLSPSILAPSQASFAVHSFFVLSLLLSAVLSLLTTALVSGDFLKKLFLIEG